MDEGEDEALERLKRLDHVMHSGKLEGSVFMSNDDTEPGVLLMLETFKDDKQNFNLSILDEDCDRVAAKGFDFIEKVQDRRLDIVSEGDVVSFSDYKKMAESDEVTLPVSSNYVFKDKEKKDNGEDDAS